MIQLTLLGLVALLMLIWVATIHMARANKNYPPSLPWYTLIPFAFVPRDVMKWAHQKYGPAAMYDFFFFRVVFIFDKKLAKKFYGGKFEDSSAADGSRMFLHKCYPRTSEEHVAKQLAFMRKYAAVNIEQAMAAVSDTTDLTLKKMWGHSGEIDLFKASYTLTLRNILTLCIGAENEPLFAELYPFFYNVFNPDCLILKPWNCFNPFFYMKNRDKTEKDYIAIFEKVVANRLALDEPRNDMLQTCIRLYKKGDSYDYAKISYNVFSFVMGGSLNTYRMLSWACVHLMTNPTHFQTFNDLLTETDITGEDSTIDSHKYSNLQFVEWVAKESLRVNGHAMTLRLVKTELDLETVTLPEKSVAIVLTGNLYRHSDIPDTTKWNPARYGDPKQTALLSSENVPLFGTGAHDCPGERLALVSSAIVLCKLFATYDVELVMPLNTEIPRAQLFAGAFTSKPVYVRYRRKAGPDGIGNGVGHVH